MLNDEPGRKDQGVVGRGGDGGGLEAGLGAEPGEDFVDALLEGNFGLAEDGVGLPLWRRVGMYECGYRNEVEPQSALRQIGRFGDQLIPEVEGRNRNKV